jgi:hypothetical protein
MTKYGVIFAHNSYYIHVSGVSFIKDRMKIVDWYHSRDTTFSGGFDVLTLLEVFLYCIWFTVLIDFVLFQNSEHGIWISEALPCYN